MNKSKTDKHQSELEKIKNELIQAQEKEKRALADYQNLVKRNQQERLKLHQLASRNLIESLITPLEHLSLAAKEIDDPGLNMVIKDFWQVLTDAGLKEFNPLGQEFDVSTMDAIEKEGQGVRVKKVVKPGYALNGTVLQHAKVIVE